MKTNHHNCLVCKAEESVRIDSFEPTSEGFQVIIHRCSKCKNQMTADELWEHIESRIKNK